MGASCHACIGGTNVREDIHRLQAGVNIVVGTPGRVYDMISRRALSKQSYCVNLFVCNVTSMFPFCNTKFPFM